MKILISESQYKLLIETTDVGSILIVGDSHTIDGYNRYSSLIKNNYSNVDIVAIGGKRTEWMKGELKKALEQKKYDKVFIYGGNNDMFSNVTKDSALNNIQDMVNMVNSQGGKAYVISGFDTESMIDGNYTKPTLDRSGNVLASPEVLKKMRERYIDFQKSLSKITSAEVIPTLKLDKSGNVSGDNVHYTNSAHKSMYDFIKPYVDEKVTEKDKKTDGLKNIDSVSGFFISIFNAFFKMFGIDKVIDLNGLLVSDSSVEILQAALKHLNYFPEDYKPDGIFDSETEKAVKKFQSENGLTEDGELDAEDMKKVIQVLEDKGFNMDDLEKLKKETFKSSSKKTEDSFSVLSNPPMTIDPFPSDLNSKFKKAVGEDVYDEFINDCKSIGLDPTIALRQLYTESAFSENVIKCKQPSTAGALGIAQFMPGTWNSVIKDGPCSQSKPTEGCCDYKKALKGYIKLMKEIHLKKFPNRLDLAIASYNSGTNWPKYNLALEDGTPFGEINTKYQGKGDPIPQETIRYAYKILQP